MDNTIILILVAAGMFAIIGGITLISHIYNLNEIKSKTVGDGQHGTARFSTKGELRKIYKYIPYEPKVWRKQAKKGKLKLPQGVILGVKGGETTITVETQNGKTDTAKVTVIPAPQSIRFKQDLFKMGNGNTFDLLNSGMIENIPADTKEA